MIEAQGRTYNHNRHQICPIHTGTIFFPRPSTYQDNPIPGSSGQQDPPISGPSSNKDSPITTPSSTTLPQTTHFPLKDPAKEPKQSCILTLRCQASSICSPTLQLQKTIAQSLLVAFPLYSLNSFQDHQITPTSPCHILKTSMLISLQDPMLQYTIIQPFQDHQHIDQMKYSTS